jgi:hypothetical protein
MLEASTIRGELNRVLSSSVFANAPRMSRFLEFLVEETPAGNGARIKEYVIALEVFEKDQNYDPHADSTVRTEASKLRARLDRYYGTVGQTASVVISIPKGSYIPLFEVKDQETLSVRTSAVEPERPATAPSPATPRRRWHGLR